MHGKVTSLGAFGTMNAIPLNIIRCWYWIWSSFRYKASSIFSFLFVPAIYNGEDKCYRVTSWKTRADGGAFVRPFGILASQLIDTVAPTVPLLRMKGQNCLLLVTIQKAMNLRPLPVAPTSLITMTSLTTTWISSKILWKLRVPNAMGERLK